MEDQSTDGRTGISWGTMLLLLLLALLVASAIAYWLIVPFVHRGA